MDQLKPNTLNFATKMTSLKVYSEVDYLPADAQQFRKAAKKLRQIEALEAKLLGGELNLLRTTNIKNYSQVLEKINGKAQVIKQIQQLTLPDQEDVNSAISINYTKYQDEYQLPFLKPRNQSNQLHHIPILLLSNWGRPRKSWGKLKFSKLNC